MREIKFRAWDGIQMLKYAYVYDSPEGWLWMSNPVTVGVKQVMQYTGLKDKNGKEIYEGDIVEWKDWVQGSHVFVPMVNKIVWNGLKAQFQVDFSKGQDIGDFDVYHIKVIGNIYENPELLSS